VSITSYGTYLVDNGSKNNPKLGEKWLCEIVRNINPRTIIVKPIKKVVGSEDIELKESCPSRRNYVTDSNEQPIWPLGVCELSK
jgi:hypothetical protein